MARNRKLDNLIEDKYIKDDSIQLEAHIKPRTAVTTS